MIVPVLVIMLLSAIEVAVWHFVGAFVVWAFHVEDRSRIMTTVHWIGGIGAALLLVLGGLQAAISDDN